MIDNRLSMEAALEISRSASSTRSNNSLDGSCSRSDATYVAIRDAILCGQFEPGGRLPQQRLAKWLGVSQSTVREALQRLVVEGYAVSEPYKGTRAARVSMKTLKELYEMRMLLEGLAVELAATRMTDESLAELRALLPQTRDSPDPASRGPALAANRLFHRAVVNSSGGSYLVHVLEQIWQLIEPYAWLASGQYWRQGTPGEERLQKMEQNYQEHAALVEALEQRNARNARKIAVAHISHQCSDIAKLIDVGSAETSFFNPRGDSERQGAAPTQDQT